MSLEVHETPVEPLVLGDDTTPLIEVPVAPVIESGLRKPLVGLVGLDDDDDDAGDDEKEQHPSADAGNTIVAPSTESPPLNLTPRPSHSRMDSQNSLVQELTAEVISEPTPEPPLQDDVSMKEPTPLEAIEESESPREKSEHEQPSVMTMAALQEFLYHKIVENQCNSHAKEIQEYTSTHFTENQLMHMIPQVILHLSQQFQHEAKSQEVSLDIQSSLCLVEQMLLPVGRRSPFQDIYTAEEEEMLNQLVSTNSSNNVTTL